MFPSRSIPERVHEEALMAQDDKSKPGGGKSGSGGKQAGGQSQSGGKKSGESSRGNETKR